MAINNKLDRYIKYPVSAHDLYFMYGEMLLNFKERAEIIDFLHVNAKNGNPVAQCYLGFFYENGDVYLEQNTTKATEFYKRSAEQNFGPAQFSLGSQYHYGKGVVQDINQAVKWYVIAAKNDCFDACYYLGMLYFEGLDIELDYVQAYFWLNQAVGTASEPQSDHAHYLIGYMNYHGLGVEVNYQKAFTYLLTHAEHQSDHAQYLVGYMYLNGLGVKQDFLKAYNWLNTASEFHMEAKKLLETNDVLITITNSKSASAGFSTYISSSQCYDWDDDWEKELGLNNCPDSNGEPFPDCMSGCPYANSDNCPHH